MPTGKSVRGSIHSALTKEARQQETWRSQADAIESRILQTRQQLSENFQALSQTYLAEKDSEEVRAALGPVMVQAERSLEERRKLNDDLNAELPISQQTLADLSSTCESLQTQRDDLMLKLTSLDNEARATGAFQGALAQQEAMQQTIEANRKRATSLKDLSKRKLVSYHANRVFRYLVERSYGLPSYSANALAARLDGMAARSVNFAANFERYQALVSIPGRVDQDVTLRELQLVEFTDGPLAETEKSARESVGYFPIKEEFDRIQESLRVTLAKREGVQNRLLAIQQKLAAIVGGTDEHLVQALNLVGRFLHEIPDDVLQKIAHGTPDQSDDAYVAKIAELRTSLNSDLDQARDLSEKIQAASTRVSRLQKLEQDFRRRDYDGSYTNFPSLDINTLLTGYLLGRVSDHDFFSTVQHHYVDDTPVVTTTSSWGSSSSSWGGSSDSGFGGGGFSSGGGFGGDSGGGGGGGFSSGDGF